MKYELNKMKNYMFSSTFKLNLKFQAIYDAEQIFLLNTTSLRQWFSNCGTYAADDNVSTAL